MWARVEGELRAALAGVDVSAEVRERVLEFLDVNELGLAFRWLVAALADTNAEVSEAVRARLAATLLARWGCTTIPIGVA